MKKKLLLPFLVLCTVVAYGQESNQNYKIEGTLIGAKDGDQVGLMRGGRQNETATITKEKFVFSFNMEYPDLVRLLPPGGGMALRMFIVPGTVKFTSNTDSWTNATFEGDAVDDWNFYINQTRSGGDRGALSETIKAHPDSPLSGFLLNTYLTAQTDYALSKELYDGLSEKGKSSHHAKLFKETSDKQGALEQSRGKQAPAFTLVDKDEQQISLSDYNGKYLILDFWGSWCGPCRMSHPHLIEIYNKYKGKNFDILGLANQRGESTEKWLQAIEEDGLLWKQVNLTTNEKGMEVVTNYNVRAYPTKILISPRGEILALYVGNSSEMDAKLKEIFGE